jgi:hypothetical protein
MWIALPLRRVDMDKSSRGCALGEWWWDEAFTGISIDVRTALLEGVEQLAAMVAVHTCRLNSFAVL